MRKFDQYKKEILQSVYLIIMLFFSTSIYSQSTHMKFNEQEYIGHLKFLADDLLEGRKPGMRGGDLAALYIARQFDAMGLKPISAEHEYFQVVPAIGFAADYKTVQCTIHTKDKKETLVPYEEIVLLSQEPNENIQMNADLVFVGYGIDAPEYDWDDFKGQDLSDKILVFLCNDPDYKTTKFGSESWTYYSMWTYKEQIAILRKAKGIIYIHNDEMATFSFSVVQRSCAPEWSYLESRTKNPLTLYAWISQPAIERVLSMVNLSFNILKKKAENKNFQPIPMKLTLDISFNQKYRQFESSNVIGILPGTEKANEAILFMAHYDHLGIGEPVNGDSIYNGARDNASGTAALITLARVFSNNPAKRNIIFLATTGEESNFLGSEYYVANPIFPLENTIIGFNMDMMSFYGRREMFSLYPIECSDAVQDMKSLGYELGLKLEPDGIDEIGLVFRSDHFPFNVRGVMTFTVGLGGDYLTMPKDEVVAIRKQVGNYYHQPNDEVYPWFQYDGVMQELEVLYHVGRYYADDDKKPNLKPENPYNAATRIIKMMQKNGIY